MNTKLKDIEERAESLLEKACRPEGILASPTAGDNYRRVWARDSMIAGMAAILAQNKIVIQGFRRSIQTLAKYQHTRGMIPSNVSIDSTDSEVSYGSLAGRVDATTWFITGACLYLLNFPDDKLKQALADSLRKALHILDCWEFNGQNLLFTPPGGNWADEYSIQGYTLYDNLLRLWGIKLFAKLYEDEERSKQAEEIKEKIKINFWPVLTNVGAAGVYHPRAFTEIAEANPAHFACSVEPRGYNMRFDTAGHALAMLLGLAPNQKQQRIYNFTQHIFDEIGVPLLPAFWPVTTSDDAEWNNLLHNYKFNFKNRPYHYHNGGIWPVWMGLFGLGAATHGRIDLCKVMLNAWIEAAPEFCFREYITSDTLEPCGKPRLCYSAAGLIFLVSAINQRSVKKLKVETD